MLTVDEEYVQAREEPPFSNSDMGYGWMARNCDRCWHDKGARNDTGPGCPLVAVAMLGRTPQQWSTQTEKQAVLGDFICVEFRNEDDGPGGEPQPIPDPPGQLALVDRERYTAVRMLTTIPEAQPSHGAAHA